MNAGAQAITAQPSADNWFAFFRAPTSGSGFAYAECASTKKLRYVSATKRLPGPGVAAHTATCPRRTAVSGGGVQLIGSQSLITSSRPFDGGDTGKTPDDGWRGEAANVDLADAKIRVWAVCKR